MERKLYAENQEVLHFFRLDFELPAIKLRPLTVNSPRAVSINVCSFMFLVAVSEALAAKTAQPQK